MYNSSSFHTLNSDKNHSLIFRIKWFIANFINNYFNLNSRDKEIMYKKFTNLNFITIAENLNSKLSPSRMFCDIFWHSLPWNEIEKELNHFNILEVGCGKGIYGKILNEILNNNKFKYNGVDIKKHKEWDEFNKDFTFNIDISDNTFKYINNKNLIITQSAIEHFENDITFFEQISLEANKTTDPILQIHLMPSRFCLYTYLNHGVRQYSLNTISKITKLFNSNTKKLFIDLGSIRSNILMLKYVTYPLFIAKRNDKRETQNNKYLSELYNAIELDMKKPFLNNSAFSCLILETNFKSKIKYPII